MSEHPPSDHDFPSPGHQLPPPLTLPALCPQLWANTLANTRAKLGVMAEYPCEARSTLLGRLWAEPGTPLGDAVIGTLSARSYGRIP